MRTKGNEEVTDIQVPMMRVPLRRTKRDRRVGTVIADKTPKTIRVRCDFMVRAPKYEKYVRRSTVLHVHDEKDEATEGDVVEVAACRRISKLKCWRLTRVVRKA